MGDAGTLPGRWALAAGRASAKGCAICRGPTLPGARLCAPCKSALKRARLETVSELEPLPRRKSAPSNDRGDRPEARQAAVTGIRSRPLRRWRFAALIMLVAAAVSSGGYLALRLGRGASAPDGAHAASIPVASSPGSPALQAPAVRRDPVPEPTPQAAPPSVPVPKTVEAPRPVLLASPVKTIQKRAVEPAPAPKAPVVARFAAATEPPAVSTAVEAAPQPRPAPPPDRWQLLAEEVARCAREDFITGVICDQRARIKYCEGNWGQVPQCPSGISNDHGR